MIKYHFVSKLFVYTNKIIKLLEKFYNGDQIWDDKGFP